MEALTKTDLGEGDAAGEEAEYARFLAVRWHVEFTLEEGRRYNLNLPTDAAKLGLLPPATGKVVVFVIGEIVEVWDAAEWLRHQRERRYTVRMILDDLDSGG